MPFYDGGPLDRAQPPPPLSNWESPPISTRRYFIHSKQMQEEESYAEILPLLSPGLQGRLTMELMMDVLQQVCSSEGAVRGAVVRHRLVTWPHQVSLLVTCLLPYYYT